jgi:hypothetical protein
MDDVSPLSLFSFGLVCDDSNSVVITSVGPGDGELVIPAEVPFEGEVRTVREIGTAAFKGARFTKVIFPSGLEIIGSNAFEGNPELVEVVFPPGSKLCMIRACAFSRCAKLTTVVLDRQTPLVVIESGCFDGCDLRGEFVLPGATRSIGTSAFRGNSGLSAFVFDHDSSLTTIQSNCFSGTGISEMALPARLADIAQSAFAGMVALSRCELTLGHMVQCFGESAFEGTQVREITIPDRVAEIKAKVFEGVATLEDVHFGARSELAAVGARAFAGTGLVHIVLPLTVERMGSEVFANCRALSEIRFEVGSSLASVTDSTFTGVKLKTLVLPAADWIRPALFEGFDDGMDLDFVTPAGKMFELRGGLFGEKRFNMRFPREVMKQAAKQRARATFVFG